MKDLEQETNQKDLTFFVNGLKTCEKCDRLVRCRKQVTSGYGNLKSKIMFIGQCPGISGCNITGIPFTKDRSGKYFQQLLKKFGFHFDEVYTTNIVKCCPNDGRKNLNPTDEEINNCINYLLKEIKIINPKMIITVGSVARNNLIGKLDNTILNYHVWHPAYILRQKNREEEYFDQWRRVQRIFYKLKSDDDKKKMSLTRFMK